MLEFLKGPFLVLHLLCINDILDYAICNIAIYANEYSTHYSKRYQACDLCQQLELASKRECNLWDTVNWDRKWLVDWSDNWFCLTGLKHCFYY